MWSKIKNFFKSPKVQKILNRIVNVVIIIISAIILLIAISTIASSKDGYTNIFGKAVLAVKSDSMNGGKKDSFKKNDLIIINLVNDQKKQNLNKGDIVTFKFPVNGEMDFNTHRIIEAYNTGTNQANYLTKGDNPSVTGTEQISYQEIIGTYSGKIPVVGGFFIFIQSPQGFLVMIVLPAVLITVYCLVLLIRNYSKYSVEKAGKEASVDKEAEKEELKKQLMEELRKEQEEKAAEEKEKEPGRQKQINGFQKEQKEKEKAAAERRQTEQERLEQEKKDKEERENAARKREEQKKELEKELEAEPDEEKKNAIRRKLMNIFQQEQKEKANKN